MQDSLNKSLALPGLRRSIASNPLTAFLILYFLSAWPVMWSLPLSAHGVSHWEKISTYAPLAVTVLMSACALLVTWAQEGREGIRRYVARTFRWRFSVLWWALALFALPAAGIACSLAFGNDIKTDHLGTVFAVSIWGMIKGLLSINLWEEAVWMGFFQTRLERRHNIAMAALITAVPFSAAHLPLQFMGEISLENVASGFLVLCLAAVVFRLLLAFSLRGARDSVLAVGITHAMFNQVSQPGGILATLSPNADAGLCAVIALAVALPIFWWFARGKLSQAYRSGVLESDRPAGLL